MKTPRSRPLAALLLALAAAGQMFAQSPVTAAAAGNFHSMFRTADGTLWAVGDLPKPGDSRHIEESS